MCGTCPSSSALASLELALSEVEEIHGSLPNPLSTYLDRISQFPVCSPKAPVSEIGLKR